jgi:Zn-dependent peptidase ImmA (M78 family)/DNA-binding XRE family transcriptional regulator
MSTPALINPEIVEWARKRIGLSVDQVADSLDVDRFNVEAWERGRQKPTFSKAEALAKRLRIPFGYLFLSKLPADGVPLPDLRTESGDRPANPTPELMELVQTTLYKQQWYSDFVRITEPEKLPFVGTLGVTTDVKDAAAKMRSWLRLDQELRDRCRTWEQFKTAFIRNAEDIGVLVMRSGVASQKRPLSVNEFRGFAIVDSFAPAIFINSRDAKAAQIFTLAHELVHVWLGESGVSNPDPRKRSAEELNSIEKFCNRVAAELLAPSKIVFREWNQTQRTETNVTRLVRLFKVSRYVVVRQAYELDRISQYQYLDYLDKHPKLWTPAISSADEGTFYRTFFARNGQRLVLGILRALGENRISYRDASSLLSVKIPTLSKIATHVG